MSHMPARKSKTLLKASKEEIILRKEEVRFLVLNGISYSNVCRHMTEKYKFSKRTAERYLKSVREDFQKTELADIKTTKAEYLAQYRELLEVAKTNNELEEARRIIDSMTKLDDFTPAQTNVNVNVNNTIENVSNLADKDFQNSLEKLIPVKKIRKTTKISITKKK